MPAQGWPRYVPIADHALLVSFGDLIADSTSAAVLGLDRALAKSPPEGLLECIPALVSLLIEFDGHGPCPDAESRGEASPNTLARPERRVRA